MIVIQANKKLIIIIIIELPLLHLQYIILIIDNTLWIISFYNMNYSRQLKSI